MAAPREAMPETATPAEQVAEKTSFDLWELTPDVLDDLERRGLIALAKPDPEIEALCRTYNAVQDSIRATKQAIARRQETALLRAMHRCSRCGIDTTEPDLCLDCCDVLALEAS